MKLFIGGGFQIAEKNTVKNTYKNLSDDATFDFVITVNFF